jgi:hypothetical protein
MPRSHEVDEVFGTHTCARIPRCGEDVEQHGLDGVLGDLGADLGDDSGDLVAGEKG